MANVKENFTRLADDIRNRSIGKEIVYVPNPGNFGDGLIRYATKRFLYDYKINHVEFNIGFRGGKFHLLQHLLQRNSFFIYGGGGAWCNAYDFGMRNVLFLSRFTENYLVLPTTFEKSIPVSGRAKLYRRDQGESWKNAPTSDFCHDMALYLTNSPPLYRSRDDYGVGNLFRTDNESAGGPASVPRDNIDLSTLGDHMSNGDEFLRISSNFRHVNTDRLHVSIASALSGASVNLYVGNYFKIREIYLSSLKDIFPTQISLYEK